jgi:anti-sigma factor RsiW
MNISCDMAMDLIALYKDGLASDDSRAAVREHLRLCPSCAREYARYSKSTSKPGLPPEDAPGSDEISLKYTELARSLRHRHIIKTAAVAATIAVSLGVACVCLLRLLFIKHGPEKNKSLPSFLGGLSR